MMFSYGFCYGVLLQLPVSLCLPPTIGSIVLANAVGMLRNALRSVEGEEVGFSFVALMRRLMFITLELAGAAAEVVYPASLARFENFQTDAQIAFHSLQLSGWLYNFAWVGGGVDSRSLG